MGEWTLLSPAMLGFTAAALIPLALYWWHRPRRLELPWAATLFLERALQSASYRRSWWQWLLWACRVLALFLLGVAWSEPSWRTKTLKEATWHIIAFDASVSLSLDQETERSAWERAQSIARNLVQTSGANDRFSLVHVGLRADWINRDPLPETNRLMQEIDRLPCGEGTAAWESFAEQLATRLAAQPVEARPRIVVHLLTDCQASTWNAASIAAIQSLQRSARACEWQLHDLGRSAVTNTSVTQLQCLTPWVVRNRPIHYQATLAHRGDAPRKLTAVWRVNGESFDSAEVTLPPNARQEIRSELRFSQGGDQIVTLEIPSDAFAADNQRQLVVEVQNQANFLAIGGRTGETNPFALAFSSSVDQGEIAIEQTIDLTTELARLQQYDLVLIANPINFSAPTEASLLDYVSAGGGLLIAAGDLTAQDLFARQSERWPAALVNDENAAQTLGFDSLDYQHPALSMFRNFPRSGLTTTPTWRRWHLQPHAASKPILNFSDGSPAMVLRELGQGRIVVSAIPWSSLSRTKFGEEETPWTAFDQWPSFVPLVNELARYVSRGSHRQQIWQVGDSLQGLARNSSAVKILVTDPHQHVEAVEIRANRHWTFGPTQAAGIYTLQEETPQPNSATLAAPRKIAVTIPPAEGDFTRVSPEDIVGTAPLDAADFTRIHTASQPLAAVILMAVILLLLVESALAWRLGREVAR